MKKISTRVARILVVLGLVQLFYLPWQEVVPAELVILYIWLTSDELVLNWLGRYVFLVEVAYLFIFPPLIWRFLQSQAIWGFAIGFVWLGIFARLWRMYKGK